MPPFKVPERSNTVIANIRRSQLKQEAEDTMTTISNIKLLSSYNWLDSRKRTMIVPGSPPLWTPPKEPQAIPRDTGITYFDLDAAVYPWHTVEPIFRGLYTSHPSFDISSVDLVTDRNNLHKLLTFINPELGPKSHRWFSIKVEIAGNTAVFGRFEWRWKDDLGFYDKPSFDKGFREVYMTKQVRASLGHRRIISYSFGGLNLIVRHESDGYDPSLSSTPIKPSTEREKKLLARMLRSRSPGRTFRFRKPSSPNSGLLISEEGQTVPLDSTFETKIQYAHERLDIAPLLPNMYLAQNANLAVGFHSRGAFTYPMIENYGIEMEKWELDHQLDLQMLAVSLKKIISIVRDAGGRAVVKWNGANRKLHIVQASDERRILPEDLYSKLGTKEAGQAHTQDEPNEECQPDQEYWPNNGSNDDTLNPAREETT